MMHARHKSAPNEWGAESDWGERNKRWLTDELARLRARIDAQEGAEMDDAAGECVAAENDLVLNDGDPFVPALDHCAGMFGLSLFERELLLLTAGVELDSGLRKSVMRAHERLMEGVGSAQPTFSLALRTLAEPHWDALSPQRPLRRWRLVEMEGRRSPTLQPLFIDERILHFLTGVAGFDERLSGLARVEHAPPASQDSLLARRIARGLASGDARTSLVVLTQEGSDGESLRAAARESLSAIGGPGLWLLAHDLPTNAADIAQTALLIDREAALIGGVPVIELELSADGEADRCERCVSLLASMLSPALLIGEGDPAKLARLERRRILRINAPRANEYDWRTHARPQADDWASPDLDEALRAALGQFHLSTAALRGVIEQLESESIGDESQTSTRRRVWRACREAARGGLDALAQRVETQADFDDLVLPSAQKQHLREIAEHLRYRRTVYCDWKMGGKTTRGRGLCVLFAGESGTGKTLAAEAIANEAALDLYRIDLATVVSKYIGETEKNLKRVFDAAEASGAVLLFDEADALFGKRSEVKDSHDRYANVEVAYLLQRVEAYRGLAILTTNFRSALDRAFLRRIRFVVQFPFPDEAAREDIWRRELPQSAPMRDIDFASLARMQLSGGHIHSVAINAAFMAAAAGEPISMAHLRHTAHRESAKLERPLTDASQRAWS